jgi:hypothetical protein
VLFGKRFFLEPDETKEAFTARAQAHLEALAPK